MGFIILLIITTLGVAGSAAFFSVYGLAQVFSASFIPVVIMGGALELGKLVAASFLYRFWGDSPRLLKFYMSVAVLALMIVTSAGIFGFLTAAYQTDSIGLNQQNERITLYEDQKVSYQRRLDGINTQIEAVPKDYITKRIELIGTFEEEKTVILDKLTELDVQILELKTTVLTTEAKIGPIIYVAKVLGRDSDEAVFWFVLILIFVFDPLAVSLTLATNIAMRKRSEDKFVNDEPNHTLETDTTLPEDVPETDTTPVVKSDTDIDDIKKLIRDSNNSDEISKLSSVVTELSNEHKKGRVRSDLGNIIRK